MKKLARDEVIRRLREIHGFYYDYSRMIYKGGRQKIEIICPNHGIFWQVADDHLKGRGCRLCGFQKIKPTPIETEKLCNYGCGRQAKYQFKKNKKICCVQNAGQCPGNRPKELYEKMNATKLTDIDKGGLNSYQRGGLKAAKTKRQIINPKTGKNLHQEGVLKGLEAKRANIDKATGLNSLQRASIKANITKNKVREDGTTILEETAKKIVAIRSKINPETGLNSYQEAGLKGAKTKEKIIDVETGLNLNELIGKKGRETKINDIDENGLDGYERAQAKRCSSRILEYKDYKIFFQGEWEYRFLQNLEDKNGKQWLINNVTRGPHIPYIHPESNKECIYRSDFLVGNTVYEIKSLYTWFSYKNNRQDHINTSKLNAALEAGYEVILVLDDIEMVWPVSILKEN